MGDQLQKDELDLRFLDAPGVRRDEVLSKLARIDTGCQNPRLFWGRWAESKWGYWWFVAAQGGGGGDAKRTWHVKNLLVTFDQTGAVHRKALIGDENLLWRQLHNEISGGPALDLSKTEVVALKGKAHSMTFSASSLEVLSKNGRIVIPPERIVRFSHEGSHDKRGNAGMTCHSLHFREEPALGNKISFCTDAPHLLSVFEYLQQTAPPGMKWE